MIIKNLTCKNFNTDRVLIWRQIIKEYCLLIEYIKVKKNMVEDALSRSPLNGDQETTQKSSYKKETVTEINDTKEITEVTFPISLKLTKQHQQKDLSLMAKYKEGMYHKSSFRGGSNVDLILKMCEDNIVILSIL